MAFFDTYGWKYADAYISTKDKKTLSKEEKLSMVLDCKLKTSSEFVFPLAMISAASDKVQEMYDYREITVKPIDEAVIRLTGGSKRTQGLMRAILVRETYVPEGSIGKRRFAKERLPANSVGDFQIRVLDYLERWKRGKTNEWPKPKDLMEAISLIEASRLNRLLGVFSDTEKEAIDRDALKRDME